MSAWRAWNGRKRESDRCMDPMIASTCTQREHACSPSKVDEFVPNQPGCQLENSQPTRLDLT
jgi:hypothetical protein